jgi:cytochrome c peroxidase
MTPAMLKRLAPIALVVVAAVLPRAAAAPPPDPGSVGLPTAAPPAVPPSLLPERLPARYLRTLAHDPAGYDPAASDGASVSDLLLGDLLFHSPHILGAEARRIGLSCHVCHPNGATNAGLVIPGVSDRPGNVDLTTAHFRAGADNRIADPINTPSLRGARFTGPYGRDGRTASLSEFVRDVVVSEFGGAPLPPAQLAALVRYVQELDFLPNANLDARGRLTGQASESARRGEIVFGTARAGFDGGSCATCHVRSSFFRDGRVHRLATGRPPSPHAIDDGFETPTLLGTAETAPYFHDGRFATLGDVVAWFDRAFALGLSAGERSDLTAYLAAVGAVDRREDARPRAQRMVETFVYLGLLVDGDARDDRGIWDAAIEAALAEIARHPRAAAIAPTITELEGRLRAIEARERGGTPLAELRPEVTETRRRLIRLAADWAGALKER